MLAQVKLALRIQNSAFDAEILRNIAAGIDDLKVTGAQFEVEEVVEGGSVRDYNIIGKQLALQAVMTYTIMNMIINTGNSSNYEALKRSYDEQKAQLRENSDYGMTKAWEE